MGNVLKPWRSRGKRVRLIKLMDGKLIKLEAPVYVKEIIEDYPNHAIFNARTFGLGLARALPYETELQASQLYYLIPLPQGHMENLVSIKYYSPSSVQRRRDGRVLRVKLRMSKPEAALFLLQYPLIRPPDAQTKGDDNEVERNPTLSTIPELGTPPLQMPGNSVHVEVVCPNYGVHVTQKFAVWSGAKTNGGFLRRVV